MKMSRITFVFLIFCSLSIGGVVTTLVLDAIAEAEAAKLEKQKAEAQFHVDLINTTFRLTLDGWCRSDTTKSQVAKDSLLALLGEVAP